VQIVFKSCLLSALFIKYTVSIFIYISKSEDCPWTSHHTENGYSMVLFYKFLRVPLSLYTFYELLNCLLISWLIGFSLTWRQWNIKTATINAISATKYELHYI
jgi:hypothetical protein